MGRKNKAAEEEQNAIDLTPMLDVVFIMLIFFIVTASFIKEPGIEVNAPLATTAELKKNASILIAITDTNQIWLDNQRIDVRSIKNHMERLLAENPAGAVVIQADEKTNIETMTKVAQAATEAGALDVSVSTKKN
jgi:biopolymer transport protein ExbD